MLINQTYDIASTFTPIDGRNKHKLILLLPYLSELVLDKNRILLETTYLQILSKHEVVRKLTSKEHKFLTDLSRNFSEKEYQKVREIETQTNHEMKAIELYLQKELEKTSLKGISQMIHFGLTSEDANNVAFMLMVKNSLQKIIIPEIKKIAEKLKASSNEYKNLSMLGRTHGQPAVGTTLGKEFLVFYKRLNDELKILENLPFRGKLNGNIGNFNAQAFVFPKKDWLKISKETISALSLSPDLVNTQIEPYDNLIWIFQSLSRINNILINLSLDFWIYISFGYFTQALVKKEVGSTALPHKVNPIYFEGAEGGFEIANSLFELFARKLSKTRMQRDLSDSTVRRSIPTALCYSFLSYQSLNEALLRIEPNKEKVRKDLEEHFEILSEAIQNFLRSKNYQDAYEKTKEFMRGRKITKEDFSKFIHSLALSSEEKSYLLKLSPNTYTGLAERIVDEYEV